MRRHPRNAIGVNGFLTSRSPTQHRSGPEQGSGGGEIRTHGAVRLNGFQDRPVRPLRHPAAASSVAAVATMKDLDRLALALPEATKELDRHGHIVSTEGSFKAGVDGARAGLYIPGHPKVGDTARQEFYVGQAEDHFKVLDLKAHVSVPFVSTNKALRTKEWTPLEPNVVDNKYYVRGVGTVREIAVKGPVERLELVSFTR